MTRQGQARVLGRYLMCAPIAAGGMATVHLGRLMGPKGFSRTVAIKQLHVQLARDTDFVAMFLDEARLTSRIRHPNVVAPLDIIECDGEICIVMEYVHGESLGRIMQAAEGETIPLRVVTAIMVQALLGLHSAHEATDDDGHPLSIVHRDVSPQNILVGEDGITRVVDFGIAKAARRVHSTEGGKLKGKLGYMSPEQLRLSPLDRGCDIFSAGIILWELLTGRPLFTAEEPAAAVAQMLKFEPVAPSIFAELPPAFDAIALKALAVDREQRYATAREMARDLEAAYPPAGALEVSEWVSRLVGAQLAKRAEWIADVESMSLAELTQSHAIVSPQGSTVIIPSATPAAAEDGVAGSLAPEPVVAEEGPRVASRTRSLVVTSTQAPPAPRPEGWRRVRPLLWAGLALAAGATLFGFVLRGGSTPTANQVGTALHSSVLAAAPVAPSARTGAATTTPATPARGAEVQAKSTSPGSTSVEPVRVTAIPTAPATSAVPAPPSPAANGTATTQRDAAATNNTSKSAVNHGSSNTQAGITAPAAPATPAASKRAAPDCAVPYVIDAQGIKRFRPECFAKKR
ncbi:MAG: protein kinase [Polyangiaceae bacterium]